MPLRQTTTYTSQTTNFADSFSVDDKKDIAFQIVCDGDALLEVAYVLQVSNDNTNWHDPGAATGSFIGAGVQTVVVSASVFSLYTRLLFVFSTGTANTLTVNWVAK